MAQFVGLDVSQKLTAICVVDNTGRRLWRASVRWLRSKSRKRFGALTHESGEWKLDPDFDDLIGGTSMLRIRHDTGRQPVAD